MPKTLGYGQRRQHFQARHDIAKPIRVDPVSCSRPCPFPLALVSSLKDFDVYSRDDRLRKANSKRPLS